MVNDNLFHVTTRCGVVLGPLLVLAAGCPRICNDDGFAWQQQPNCLLAQDDTAASVTDTTAAAGTADASESATAATTDPTTSGVGGTWCVDADMDGYGDPAQCTEVPPGDAPPPGTVDNDEDCDDGDGLVWSSCGSCVDDDGDGAYVGCDAYPPGAPLADCDDSDPNTAPGAAPNDDPEACMTDADGDDWGDAMPVNPSAAPGSDCDDQSATTFPGAAPLDDPNACMNDDDDDDFGDAQPGSGVLPGSDCFDANAGLNPGASALITAPLNTGEITEIDPATGAMSSLATIDVNGIAPWIPTSIAVDPGDGSIYAALAFKDRLATMNYCGAGVPTLLPAAHNKNICGITFDRDGNLYGIDGQVDQLLVFKPDGSVGPGGIKALTYMGQTLNVADCGMSYDCHEDRILVSDSGSAGIYSVQIGDGTTERLASIPGKQFGSGLAYDPTTRRALSCDQTSFLSIAVDGSDEFSQLKNLMSAADDLEFGPACE